MPGGNEWLPVLLWDLGGLKGRIIAPNMGKKMGSSSTFIMSFSARGVRGLWQPSQYQEKSEITEMAMLSM